MYWSRVYDLSIQKILTFLIQWFLRRSQRHQSYFHLVSYFNHFHLQEVVTFRINEFMFLLERWWIEKKVGMKLFQWLSRWFTNEWIQTPGEKKSSHVLIYKGEEKYSRCVFIYGEHSILKHSQVIIMQQSISTVFIWLDILTITDIKQQSNRYIIFQLIQIYSNTAYTITDTVNI